MVSNYNKYPSVRRNTTETRKHNNIKGSKQRWVIKDERKLMGIKDGMEVPELKGLEQRKRIDEEKFSFPWNSSMQLTITFLSFCSESLHKQYSIYKFG